MKIVDGKNVSSGNQVERRPTFKKVGRVISNSNSDATEGEITIEEQEDSGEEPDDAAVRKSEFRHNIGLKNEDNIVPPKRKV